MWFLLGVVYGNIIEYSCHRYLFHGLGKKKTSVFAFHLREHHINCRRNDYEDKRFSMVEVLGLLFLLLLHLPLLFIVPSFFVALAAYAVAFIVIHNGLHIFPEVGKKYFKWHWNHHMSNQNKSWGVVMPLMDILTGTLEKPQR